MNKIFRFSFSTLNAAYIVASKRTAIGTFKGKLAKFRAPELSTITI